MEMETGEVRIDLRAPFEQPLAFADFTGTEMNHRGMLEDMRIRESGG